VAAVLDTTPFATKAAAAPGMLRGPATFAKGLYYIGWLRAHGVHIAEGVTPLAIEGEGTVERIRWRDAKGRERRVECDAVALGWGLKPEAQLADLAGIPFEFDGRQHGWAPRRDAAGRSPVPGLYLAGDGSGIGGADVAELGGQRTALALLQDAGHRVETAALDARLARLARFRAALERAFPFPGHLAANLPDDAVFCRCENLTAGELRATTAGPALGAPELNRAKAISRAGMGRCQGRVCGAAAAEILAAQLGCTVAEVGRLRGQAPVKPIPLGTAP
jgi:NADPH-dependent 2,4-dienoyl-CoA reductase/sulfur reductase-like enzyme